MILTAALNNALQAGSAEVVAASVIISDVVSVERKTEVVQIDQQIETIVIEVPNG